MGVVGVVVDIILIAVIVFGVIAGAKRGLIKELVGLVGLVSIVIISYTLRTPLATFLIDKLPFLPFAGSLTGVLALSILIYNAISFVVIFVVLYCLLSIIIKVSGFIDTLLKLTVIWVIPSKIGGGILGFMETWVYLFIVLFVLAQFSITNMLIHESRVTKIILNNTPIVGTYMRGAKNAALEIYDSVREFEKDDTKTQSDLNLRVLQIEINYGLVSKAKANELIETGKLELDGVQIAKKESSKWLNI